MAYRDRDYRAGCIYEGRHFAHAGASQDKQRLAEYEAGLCKGYGKRIEEAFAAIVPDDANVGAVAEAIVKVVDAPLPAGARSACISIPPGTEPR